MCPSGKLCLLLYCWLVPQCWLYGQWLACFTPKRSYPVSLSAVRCSSQPCWGNLKTQPLATLPEMAHPAHRLAFTLADLHQSACRLVELRPGCIVTYRLLREVHRLPSDDPLLAQAKDATENSKWVNQLNGSQLPDGSWGRFRSKDTKTKTMFRTTEAAIDRAFALGLEPGEGCLARVQHYIMEVLRGEAHITDRRER